MTLYQDKLDQELVDISPAEWLETLKGIGPKQYKKARKHLGNNTGGFCCLGVLADMRGVTWGENCYKADGLLDQDIAPYWLSEDMQEDLGKLNDRNTGWEKVIEYIQNEIG